MSAAILPVTPAQYHRLPQFSASLAKILIGQCASKARDAWERRAEKIAAEDESDAEDEKPTDEKQAQLDRGTVLHALVLGKGEERIEIIPKELLSGKNFAYQSAEAKARRDAARAAGRVPVKEPKMPVLQATADAIKSRLAAAGHHLDGQSELVIVWTERTPHGDVECRAMLDHVILWGQSDTHGPTGAIIDDLKIVGDAHPDRCERTAEGLHYEIQAAAYKRALNALYPTLAGRIEFRLLFCEAKRPYELWDPTESGPFREIGERRWLRAVHAWAEGLATGRWPGYRTPDRAEITKPIWTLRQEGFTADEA